MTINHKPTTSIEDQKEFYNAHWQRFDYANRLRTARCAAIISALARFNIYQPSILDLGCGTGWLAGILGTLGPTTAIELSDEAITQAKERYPYVRFIAADFFELKWGTTLFDIVVSQEVIEHVENQAAYLQIAYQALKPGGYLIMTTPNPRTMNAMVAHMRDQWSRQPIENWIKISDLKALLKRNFEITLATTIITGHGSAGLYRVATSQKLRRLLHSIGLGHAFDHLSCRFGFGLHTLVVARKPLNETA